MGESSKLEYLRETMRGYRSVLVAFSGGVDSAFVLKIARDVLGREHVKAVTAESESVSSRELEAAKQLARALDTEHILMRTRELEDENYKSNPTDRCYYCKTELYRHLVPMAREWNFETIVNGTNLDDLGDVRPGLRAAEEHGIKSPLVEARLTKQEIRELSRQIGLPVWDKPAEPCLSSRLPYGHEIAPEKLKQIEAGENFLKDLGFRVVRLRHFGQKTRIELGRDEFLQLMDAELRDKITQAIRSLGFKVVIFEPYQSGRLNQEVMG
jgi:uncharacterized protein